LSGKDWIKTRDESNDSNINNDTQGDFDEKYDSTDDFLKRSVSSLFDDIPSAKPTGTPSTADKLPRLPRFNADPEEEYAKYLQSAEKHNRNELQRKVAAKEETQAHHEQELAQFSSDVGKHRSYADPSPAPEYSYGGGKPQKRNLPPINLRNIVALGLFVVLIIFVLLVWQLISANNRSAAAESTIAEYLEELLELRDLPVIIEGLNTTISELRAANTSLQNELATANTSGAIEDPDNQDETPGGAASPPSNQGSQRTYTVQAGDSGLMAIAASQLGDGSRWREIMELNNMPNDTITPGQELILPD